jgi:hypothetical protein
MEYLKKKSGGCSSMNYAGVSDNYMLMDNAIAKTGGARKSKSKKSKKSKSRGGGDLLQNINEKELFSGGNPPNDMFGGALRRRGGGEHSENTVNDKLSGMFGGSFRRRGGEPPKQDDMFGGSFRRRGGEPPAAPVATGLFGMGSAITDVTKTLGLTSGGGNNDKRKERDGGCGLRRCNKNKDERKKGGTTGVELAPFISSLVILGLRAANDKALQSGITKKLGSLVSSSKKSKKSKSRRTKSAST